MLVVALGKITWLLTIRTWLFDILTGLGGRTLLAADEEETAGLGARGDLEEVEVALLGEPVVVVATVMMVGLLFGDCRPCPPLDLLLFGRIGGEETNFACWGLFVGASKLALVANWIT